MSQPTGEWNDDRIRVGGDARQRFYDARGIGHPVTGNEIDLDPVEAAYLLGRGDLASVDGADFRSFFEATTDANFGVRYLVYSDLRARGYSLSPARWVGDCPDDADFIVYERGSGPVDDRRAHVVVALGERTVMSVGELPHALLAAVDEESEVTYLAVERGAIDGSTSYDLPAEIHGTIVDDRVVIWSPPADLYHRGFFGHPFAETSERAPVQLSLVEAAYLESQSVLSVAGDRCVTDHGRALGGDRFDRRLAVYRALRGAGVVPKTGFKFGADFRTYADVASVDTLDHAEHLVQVLAPDEMVTPRDLAHDVRLAHGVRKRMVFAITEPSDDTDITWRTLQRVTP